MLTNCQFQCVNSILGKLSDIRSDLQLLDDSMVESIEESLGMSIREYTRNLKVALENLYQEVIK
jgi:hypothetical protein